MNQDYQGIIDRMRFKIELFDQGSAVLARVQIDLVDPPIMIQGYTIRINQEQNKLYLAPPSYKSKYNKFCPIVWTPTDFWQLLDTKILGEYKITLRDGESNFDFILSVEKTK